MPLILTNPVTMKDGTVITSYKNTVHTTPETFTFRKPQEWVKLYNRGTADIVYTIGTQSGTLRPSQHVEVEELIDSIILSSIRGTQHFEVRTDEEGTTVVGTGEIKGLGARIDDVISTVKEVAHYEEIEYTKHRDDVTGTDYWLTRIPNLDKNGEVIELKHGYQNDSMNSGDGETSRSFSVRNNTSFAANASVWNTSTGLIWGIQIQNGEILQSEAHPNNYILGIKSDNTLVAYPPTTTADAILTDGCQNAVTAFFPMMENGVAVDPAIYAHTTQPNENHPRQVIAQLPNKDILFLTCSGRNKTNKGFTYDDAIRILTDEGVSFAYCLDGGGSAQAAVRGVLVSEPLDDNGKTERKVHDFIYVQKPVDYPGKLKTVSTDIGTVNKRISDLKADFMGLGSFPINPKQVSDLNTITENGLYWANGTTVGVPATDCSWAVVHWHHSTNNALQVAFPFHNTYHGIRWRRTNADGSGTYYAWRS
jgi:exopolysaccharide biosynthesis protein